MVASEVLILYDQTTSAYQRYTKQVNLLTVHNNRRRGPTSRPRSHIRTAFSLEPALGPNDPKIGNETTHGIARWTRVASMA